MFAAQSRIWTQVAVMITITLWVPQHITYLCVSVCIYVYICVCVCVCEQMSVDIYIGIMVREFMNGLEDQSSIPGGVIPKTQKMVLDASLLNIQHYNVWIKGKWSNPRKGVVPSSTPWFSSYWKGSLQVTLDYNWLTYFIYIYIYILTHTHIYKFIYCHPQTDLFRSIRTHQCGLTY